MPPHGGSRHVSAVPPQFRERSHSMHTTISRRGPWGRRFVAGAAVAALAVTATACSKQGAASTAQDQPSGNAVTIQGDVSFNDANLAKLDAALKQALAGKDLSKLDQAMVVNIQVDYWNAGKTGFAKGCKDLGLSDSQCH